MSIFQDSLVTILPLFLLILIGYATKRTGLFDSEDARALNDLIIYLAIPCLIFKSVVTRKFEPEHLLLVLIFIVLMAAAAGVTYLAARVFKVSQRIIGVLLIGSFLGNTGYLGYPITLSLLGDDALARAVFIDVLGTVLVLFTAGLYLVERLSSHDVHVHKLKAIVTFPPFIALVLGIGLAGTSIPPVLSQVILILSQAAVPIIMVSIGINLTFAAVRGSLKAYSLGVFVKLGLMPLLAVVLFDQIPSIGNVDPLGSNVVVLQASMPTAMMTQVLAVRYGLEADFLPALIFITTLLSLFTVPLWLLAVM